MTKLTIGILATCVLVCGCTLIVFDLALELATYRVVFYRNLAISIESDPRSANIQKEALYSTLWHDLGDLGFRGAPVADSDIHIRVRIGFPTHDIVTVDYLTDGGYDDETVQIKIPERQWSDEDLLNVGARIVVDALRVHDNIMN